MDRYFQLNPEKLAYIFTTRGCPFKCIFCQKELTGRGFRVRSTQMIVDELRAVRTKYGDDRRTEIIEGESGELSIEDLITDEDMAITVTNTGYIKRTPITTYRAQRRGGKGRIGMRTREEDYVSHLFVASTHAYIMIFTDRGRAYWLKVHEVPDVGPGGKGKAIVNLVQLEADEKIAALAS